MSHEYQGILDVGEGWKEHKAGWSGFPTYLKGWGLVHAELFISDISGGREDVPVVVEK